MGWKAVVCAGCLTPVLGCNLAQYASHNLINEPITRLDETRLTNRVVKEAKMAWREVCRQYPARTFTPEFADGFIEGYADHLENGGRPLPPAVPPLRYRRSAYLTPDGHALIRDYLVGFKYGAEVACATGRRQFLTVPVALPEEPEEPPTLLVKLPPPPDPHAEPPSSAIPSVPPSDIPPLPLTPETPGTTVPKAKPLPDPKPRIENGSPIPTPDIPGISIPNLPGMEAAPGRTGETGTADEREAGPVGPLPPVSAPPSSLPPATAPRFPSLMPTPSPTGQPTSPSQGFPEIHLPVSEGIIPSGGVSSDPNTGPSVLPAVGHAPISSAEAPSPLPPVTLPPAALPPVSEPPAAAVPAPAPVSR